MATGHAFLPIDGAGNTLALFQAWSELISNTFAAAGWTRTADTGQTTLTSLTQGTLPSSGQFAFEIWQAGDSFASTFPMTVKIGYGSATNNAAEPSFSIQVGSGSNGTGTLLNAAPNAILSTNTNLVGNNLLFECNVSGTSSRMTCVMFREWEGSFFFNIERSHNSSGADTGEYFTAMYGGINVQYGQVSVLPAAQGGPLPVETAVTTVNTTNTTGLIPGANGALSAGPVFPIVGRIGNPLLGAVSVKGGDVASGTLLPISLYGTVRNYLVAKNLFGTSGTMFRIGGGTALALLYQ